MRRFGTHGRVRPEQHYIVSRSLEITDFISRVKDGKYIVLFAPRQTGKTTFFRLALDALTEEDPTYFPIQLDFQTMRNASPATFYEHFHYMIHRHIAYVFQTPAGDLEMQPLLDNFQSFIARAGFRILQVPDTPQEYVGQYLLYAYLDHFVNVVGANMFLEVQTGRGRIDLIIIHNQRKHIVETKIWEGVRYYQAGKKQLAAYMKLEEAEAGYYVVFDHRQKPEARIETAEIDDVKIRSYVIPVVQRPPSSVRR